MKTLTATVKGETKSFQARGLLGGCYRGHQEERATLNHAMQVDAAGDEIGEKTLCRKVTAEKLVDVYGMDADAEVTCPECLRRLAKMGATTV